MNQRIIDRYEIVSEIGDGGFATVYLARDPVLERDLAIKVLHPHLARDAQFRERFIREGRALARLRHPNLVQVFDAGESDGDAFLAMEFVSGSPLSQLMEDRTNSLAELLPIFRQVAGALDAVHAAGLVHRDVKPANIVLAGDGRAVLLDLGIARDLGKSSLTPTSHFIGSPGYLAPEQLTGLEDVSPATDVYQLAATIYALLAGHPPFEGEPTKMMYSIVYEMPPDLSTIRPDLPPDAVAGIARGLAKGPSDRPQRASDLVVELSGRESAALPPNWARAGTQIVPNEMLQSAPVAPAGSGVSPTPPTIAGLTALYQPQGTAEGAILGAAAEQPVNVAGPEPSQAPQAVDASVVAAAPQVAPPKQLANTPVSAAAGTGPNSAGRGRLLAIGAGLLLIVLVVGGAFALSRGTEEPIASVLSQNAGERGSDEVRPLAACSPGTDLAVAGAQELVANVDPGCSPVALTFSSAGQRAKVTLNGTANQRVSFQFRQLTIGTNCWCTRVTLLKPDGTNLVSPFEVYTPGGEFVDTVVLPATGAYTMLIEPKESRTGSLVLSIHDVPPDATGTISTDGSSTSVTTTTPGQNAVLTFAGKEKQRLSMRASKVAVGENCWCLEVSILRPDGTALVKTQDLWSPDGGFIDTMTLPVNGNYKLIVDPRKSDFGSLQLTLFDVPADPTSTLAVGGQPVTVTTTTPGQNAKLTFEGRANQQVSMQFLRSTIGANCWCTQVAIAKPDGTELVKPVSVWTPTGAFMDTVTLPQAGTYTLTVDPQKDVSGSVELVLRDVPANASGELRPGGAPVTVTTTVPGQNATITFEGRAQQRITLKLDRVAIGTNCWCTKVSILGPTKTELTPTIDLFTPSGAWEESFTLPATGTYSILVDPREINTGSLNATLSEPPR